MPLFCDDYDNVFCTFCNIFGLFNCVDFLLSFASCPLKIHVNLELFIDVSQNNNNDVNHNTSIQLYGVLGFSYEII